jgi:hypothetical protein
MYPWSTLYPTQQAGSDCGSLYKPTNYPHPPSGANVYGVRIECSKDTPNTLCAQGNGTHRCYKITKASGWLPLGSNGQSQNTTLCALFVEVDPNSASAGVTWYTIDSIGDNYDNCNDSRCPSLTASSSTATSSSAAASFSAATSSSSAEVTVSSALTSSSPVISSALAPSSSAAAVTSSSATLASQAPAPRERCFRALSPHTATVVNAPGDGANWASYWEECDCCPTIGCKLFTPYKVDIRGPWEGALKGEHYNYNLMILQGDTICYEFEVFENGLPLNLADWDAEASIKIRFTDSASIEKFSTDKFVGVDGVLNGLEISLSATKTECLPITELVYDIEITHKTLGYVTKVHSGYLNVLPEVTRASTACSMFGLGTTAPPTASSATTATGTTASSAAPTCCTDFCVYRVLNTTNQTYTFLVDTNTEDITLKGFTEWHIDMIINEGLANNLTEVELIYNTIDPAIAPANYDCVYPIGGGKYRFVDKRALGLGSIVSAFSIPIPVATYNTAKFRLRGTTANCVSTWQEAVFNSTDTQQCFACPVASSAATTSSSTTSSSTTT